MPLNLTATYIQALVKATTFDPIKEFPDIFPEKIPDELPPLREPHMQHHIKLIDPNKIINPEVILSTSELKSAWPSASSTLVISLFLVMWLTDDSHLSKCFV